MKVCIFGLGKSATSDGNGLAALGLPNFSCWDKLPEGITELIVHSLGFKSAMDYIKAHPQVIFKLTAIEPVPDNWRWIRSIFVKTEYIKMPPNVFCYNYLTGHSWGCYLSPGPNVEMPKYGHTSIVPEVVKVLKSAL